MNHVQNDKMKRKKYIFPKLQTAAGRNCHKFLRLTHSQQESRGACNRHFSSDWKWSPISVYREMEEQFRVILI